MGTISCLHISDLHFGELDNSGVESFHINICNDLKENEQYIDYIICSGDIFYGKTLDREKILELAIGFFKKLMTRLNKLSLGNNKIITENDFIFVPGNHDIIRNDDKDIYSLYKKFLISFYTLDRYEILYDPIHLSTTRIEYDKKIVIIGLNSCALVQQITNQDRQWIDKLNLSSLALGTERENEIKSLLLSSKYEFDDYGEISMEQLTDTFDNLLQNITDIESYRVIVAFHHHIYPFPEIYNKYGDSSMIRNFAAVVDYFFANNVSIILHGHKHASIARPIVTNKFYNNPNKIMHVFSAGTIGSDRGEKSFEVVEVHSLNEVTDALVTKYSYIGMECQSTIPISVPPQETPSIGYVELLDILKVKNNNLYNKYIYDIQENDNISYYANINNIISYVSSTLTVFNDTRKFLTQKSEIIYIMLLCIHYRILAFNNKIGGENNNTMLIAVKEHLSNIINDEEYMKSLCELMEIIRSDNYNKKFKLFFENESFFRLKKTTSYIISSIHFVDLYLALSRYGEFYFKNEGIKNKVNFKLEENHFHINIPIASINFVGDSDRRSAIVNLKCKEPTVHKAVVLIIKNFEDRILKIEDAFKEIGLKLYYIRPKVEKFGYDLDNYNFEAYIPKLLPLLTGEHLYKQKEVFIRELIQNSIDAISLRKKITHDIFDDSVYILFTEVQNNGKNIKCIKIRDNGIGMDLYKIERYFTSIGRSYYTSDDYEELLEDIDIKSKPISNFGIGFLSVFLACKEVSVLTKSIEEDKEGIDLHIPNYEGCFFVKKAPIQTAGTEITLYEDDKNKFAFNNIIRYVTNTVLNPSLKIVINDEINNKLLEIAPNNLFESYKSKKDILFIPFEEDEIVDLPFEKIEEGITKYKYGVIVDFQGNDRAIIMNEGIKIAGKYKGIVNDDVHIKANVLYNFPASYVQLDVARERIVSLKYKDKGFLKDFTLTGNANNILNKQALAYIGRLKRSKAKIKIIRLNELYYFLGRNALFLKELFILRLSLVENKIKVNFQEYNMTTDDDNSFYIGCDCYKNENKLIEIYDLVFSNEFTIKIKESAKSKNLIVNISEQIQKKSLFEKDIEVVTLRKNMIIDVYKRLFVEEINMDLLSCTVTFLSKMDIKRKGKNLKALATDWYNNCCNNTSVDDIRNSHI